VLMPDTKKTPRRRPAWRVQGGNAPNGARVFYDAAQQKKSPKFGAGPDFQRGALRPPDLLRRRTNRIGGVTALGPRRPLAPVPEVFGQLQALLLVVGSVEAVETVRPGCETLEDKACDRLSVF